MNIGGLYKKTKDWILLNRFHVPDLRKRSIYLRLLIVIILVYLRWHFYDFFSDDSQLIAVFDLILFFLAINFISHIIRIIIVSSYRKRNKFEKDHYDNFTIGVGSILFILAFLVFIVGLLLYFDIELISFLTIFGIFFAGLSWTFKDHIVNITNGLIVMFSKDFRIGDYIKVNGYTGIIKNVTFLNVLMKTDEGDFSYIPNTVILGSEVINYTKSKQKRIIFDFEINMKLYKYIKNLEKHIFNKISKHFGDLVQEDGFKLKVGKIYDDKADIVIEIPVRKYNFTIDEKIKKFTSLAIIEYIAKRKKQ